LTAYLLTDLFWRGTGLGGAAGGSYLDVPVDPTYPSFKGGKGGKEGRQRRQRWWRRRRLWWAGIRHLRGRLRRASLSSWQSGNNFLGNGVGGGGGLGGFSLGNPGGAGIIGTSGDVNF
jgi:hypothetical protein